MSVDVLNGCDIKEDLHVEQRGSVSGPRPELVYNHAVLLDLKNHPLALIWPQYLDPAYKNSRGVWDPDRWHLEQKRSETPIEGDERKGRPLSGLAEKILKAPGTEDAIILSPQRGSFLSGCQAAKDELSLRPDGGGSVRRGLLEAGGGAGRRGPGQAEPNGPGRRVGSGRILRQDKGEEAPPARGNRIRNERETPTQRDWERGGDFSKYGFRRGEEDEPRRGGGGWDSYNQEDRGGAQRRGGRAGGMSGGRRNNEPEWMNESVTLSDIIELKGFDDGKRSSRPNSRQSNKSDRSGRVQHQQQPQQHQQQPQQQQHGGKEADGFDFDQIMESVNLNSLLGGMVQGAGEAAVVPEAGNPQPSTQSRFSQFFQARQEPQIKKNDSRRSSIQDELVANNILRELNGEPTIRIPSPEESNKYFTPISPAAKTGHGSKELMDMLKQGEQKKAAGDPMVHLLEDGIKRSLGLEKQRQQQQQQHEQLLAAQRHHQQQQQRQQQDNDLSAFKKLVAQVQSGPGDRPPPPPMAGGGAFMPGLVRPTPLGAGLPFNATTEQEILEGRAIAAQQQQRVIRQQPPAIPPQLMQFLEHYPVNPEVLKRPETEPLMNCVNNGTFPVENLVAQLSNPNLPLRQQELLLTVLKMKTRPFPPALAGLFGGPGMVPPPRSSPLPEHLAQPPPPPVHNRVSPLMFGGSVPPGGAHLSVSPGPPQTQRVPSPQEMTVLTQQILQQALIKKKLEEQKENYRKKQEVKPDREDKENIRGLKNADSAGSPLLAFTPTSVMRKNAAERKDSDPRPGVPELKVTVQEEGAGMERHQAPSSPGRPILKGKGGDRPGTLELGGRTTRNNVGGGGRTPQQQSPLMPGGGGMMGGGGIPPNVNPLLFLANPQMQGVPPAMMGGGVSQFPPGLSAIMGMGNQRMNQPIVPGGPPMRVGPPSPRSSQAPAVSPTPLSRFFPSDVLAAAAAGGGGMRQHKMPPLPTGQALTLEEIERHAAGTTVKI